MTEAKFLEMSESSLLAFFCLEESDKFLKRNRSNINVINKLKSVVALLLDDLKSNVNEEKKEIPAPKYNFLVHQLPMFKKEFPSVLKYISERLVEMESKRQISIRHDDIQDLYNRYVAAPRTTGIYTKEMVAKAIREKGLHVYVHRIYVMRFGLIKNNKDMLLKELNNDKGFAKNMESVVVSKDDMKICAEKDGLGVCFVANYLGFITPFSFVNRIINSSAMLRKRFGRCYVLYIRAFDGVHKREIAAVLAKEAFFREPYSESDGIKARNGEWSIHNNELVLRGLRNVFNIPIKK